jgi:hypothetical protein
MDQLTQLANEQAAIDQAQQPQQSQQPVAQPIAFVPQMVPVDVKQPPAPSPEKKEPSNHVPYDRFKEVVEERNKLLQAIQQAQQPVQQPVTGQVDYNNMTAEQFAKYIEQNVENKLNSVYQEKVAPLNDYVTNLQFSTKVEHYFSDPEKAKLRAEMDAYTATLTPYEQQAIKQSVLSGNSRRLDEIYYTVANERQRYAQGLANQQIQQTIPQATSPQGFRTINTVAPSFNDKLSKAAAQGYTAMGGKDAWLDVMEAVRENAR